MTSVLYDTGKVTAAAAGLSLSPPAPGAAASSQASRSPASSQHRPRPLMPLFADPTPVDGAGNVPNESALLDSCNTTKVCDAVSLLFDEPMENEERLRRLPDPASPEPRAFHEQDDAPVPVRIGGRGGSHGLSMSPLSRTGTEPPASMTSASPAGRANPLARTEAPRSSSAAEGDKVIRIAVIGLQMPPVSSAEAAAYDDEAQRQQWAVALQQQQQGPMTATSRQLSPDFQSILPSTEVTSAGDAEPMVPSHPADRQATMLARLSALPIQPSSLPQQPHDVEHPTRPYCASAAPPPAKDDASPDVPSCFLRLRVVDTPNPAAQGAPPSILKLKIPANLPFARLLEHRVMRAVYGPPELSQDIVCLLWKGRPLDLLTTPAAQGMPQGIEQVQSVHASTLQAQRETARETELTLMLREAKAKADLLEFQLVKQQKQQQQQPGTASSPPPSSGVAREHKLQSTDDVDRDLLDAAKRRSVRDYAKEKHQEALYYRQQFEFAVQELASVKLLVAQQQACLDRLGVPMPLPASLIGSAFVQKEYAFTKAVKPSFVAM